tara:strand:+ start:1029 stop:1418 length:390 start_codon:yes stop_codon:yes gene_type:complete
MKYLKHYWKSTETGDYLTTTNTIHKRHPEAEFAGLDVQIWMHDADGVDVCLARVPDTTTITEVTVGSKKAIQELTETQYNTVKTPLDDANKLDEEAAVEETGGNSELATTKRSEAETKRNEAKTALLAL